MARNSDNSMDCVECFVGHYPFSFSENTKGSGFAFTNLFSPPFNPAWVTVPSLPFEVAARPARNSSGGSANSAKASCARAQPVEKFPVLRGRARLELSTARLDLGAAIGTGGQESFHTRCKFRGGEDALVVCGHRLLRRVPILSRVIVCH